ncbi:MAG: hypothetical protein JRJ57_00265 [Deltaproteobacteria bacterium]|nr:hypothetical protein [Deltaproteobacteria bacterium]
MDSKLTASERELLTVSGFMRAYYRNLSECESYQEAYEETEKKYVALFGRRRYRNYESFRKTRDRIMKL